MKRLTLIMLFISTLLSAQYESFLGNFISGTAICDTILLGDATRIDNISVQSLNAIFDNSVFTDSIILNNGISSDTALIYNTDDTFFINSAHPVKIPTLSGYLGLTGGTLTGNIIMSLSDILFRSASNDTTYIGQNGSRIDIGYISGGSKNPEMSISHTAVFVNDSIITDEGFYTATADSLKIQYTAAGSTQISSKAPIYISTELWADYSLHDTIDIMIGSDAGTPPDGYGRMFIDTTGTDSLIIMIGSTRRGIAIE